MSSSFDRKEMADRANTFVNNSYYSSEQLREYIDNILNDAVFLSDPKAYMQAWTKRRGYTEEFRMPEDVARGFFDLNFGAKTTNKAIVADGYSRDE
jgi:hypothetical protein